MSMTMTFKRFIETKYDVRERINIIKSDPVKEFINGDIFPFDFIEIDNGEMVKMLYYANGKEKISVIDLLSYTRNDLIKLGNKDLLDLYDSYTKNFDFDFEGFDLYDPVKLDEIREAWFNKHLYKSV